MIKHPIHGTLDEFLTKIKTNVERGIPMASAGFVITWFALQYAEEKKLRELYEQIPAEPGAQSQPSHNTIITLQQIDELRELNSRGEHKQVAARLEEFAREHSTQGR